jgi:hypothetical protein
MLCVKPNPRPNQVMVFQNSDTLFNLCYRKVNELLLCLHVARRSIWCVKYLEERIWTYLTLIKQSLSCLLVCINFTTPSHYKVLFFSAQLNCWNHETRISEDFFAHCAFFPNFRFSSHCASTTLDIFLSWLAKEISNSDVKCFACHEFSFSLLFHFFGWNKKTFGSSTYKVSGTTNGGDFGRPANWQLLKRLMIVLTS